MNPPNPSDCDRGSGFSRAARVYEVNTLYSKAPMLDERTTHEKDGPKPSRTQLMTHGKGLIQDGTAV